MHRIGGWSALLLVLLTTSCTTLKQPSLKVDHYVLEYPTPGPRGLPALPVILKVQRFSVAPAYDTSRIVYRDRSFKRETYTYHRWRSHPADLVTDYLTRDLRDSSLFSAVVREGSTVSPTHVLEGSLDEFFELNAPDGWKAILTVGVTLIKAREPDTPKRVLFQQTFRAVQPYQDKTPKGLAEAMSEAMARVSAEATMALYQHLSASGGRQDTNRLAVGPADAYYTSR